MISTITFSACFLSPSPQGNAEKIEREDLEEMCDFFRKDFTDQKAVRFNVEYSAMIDDWTCVMVEPVGKGEFKAEPRWALFKKVDGAWRRKNWSAGMVFKDDFELIDLPERNSRISKLIVQKYPDCPMQIFPSGK